MASVEESLFISEFLAAYAGQPTKFRTDYIPTGLAPNLTSKVKSNTNHADQEHSNQLKDPCFTDSHISCPMNPRTMV
jgi:hypothetical protein